MGKGSFGCVRQVRCLTDKQIYAIKTIPMQSKKAKLLKDSEESQNEVEIMKDLQRKNIIHMFGSFVDVDFASINGKDKGSQAQPPVLKIRPEQIDFNNYRSDEKRDESYPVTRDGEIDEEEGERLISMMQTS